METDSDEKQLLNQILNAVKVTPSLHEDLQVEVMKVGLTWLPVCVIGTRTHTALPPSLLSLKCLCLVVIWNIGLLSLLMCAPELPGLLTAMTAK